MSRSHNNPPDCIDELVNQLTQFQVQLTTTVADIAHRLESLERRSTEPAPDASFTSGPAPTQTPPPPPRLKLDVPRFDEKTLRDGSSRSPSFSRTTTHPRRSASLLLRSFLTVRP
jgi:hypothetical protein